MKYSSKLFLIMVGLIVTSFVIACGGGETTVKIGLLSPQTGPIAVYAPGFEDAANVAITALNASQKSHQFELIVADSGCDGTQAATSAQSLID